MEFIPISRPSLSNLEEEYLLDAFRSGWVSSSGPYIEKLENTLPDFTGTKYATPVSNGTTALHLALLAIGIGPNDEVIVPNLSFVAVVNAVIYCGATPIFADVDLNSLCMTLDNIKSVITDRTKAIIAVHNYGFFSDLLPIKEYLGPLGVKIIEDCAEAPFLVKRGIKTGTIGDLATYSFFGNKIVTSGEGGCVATNNLEYLNKVNYLKNQANLPHKKFVFEDLGFNYRMTNLQAAVLVAQLERLPELLDKRYSVIRAYLEHLAGEKGIEVVVPDNLNEFSPWIISLKSNPENVELLMANLRELGIDSRPFFAPHTLSSRFEGRTILPESEMISREYFNLPTYADLELKSVEYICKSVVNYFKILS